MSKIILHIPGIAVPFKSPINRKYGKGRTMHPQYRVWREHVRAVATVEVARLLIECVIPANLHDGPVKASFKFWLPRAKSNKDVNHLVPPDTDDLIKGILDSLTGVIFTDDSRVNRIGSAEKVYGESPLDYRVQVTLELHKRRKVK